MLFLPQTFHLMYLELLRQNSKLTRASSPMLVLMVITCTHNPQNLQLAGVAIYYVSNKLDHFERDDLSIMHEDFQSIWIEIENKKGKNFLCGCIIVIPILIFPISMIILSHY